LTDNQNAAPLWDIRDGFGGIVGRFMSAFALKRCVATPISYSVNPAATNDKAEWRLYPCRFSGILDRGSM
jgi:hypothetical protein